MNKILAIFVRGAITGALLLWGRGIAPNAGSKPLREVGGNLKADCTSELIERESIVTRPGEEFLVAGSRYKIGGNGLQMKVEVFNPILQAFLPVKGNKVVINSDREKVEIWFNQGLGGLMVEVQKSCPEWMLHEKNKKKL